MYIFPINRKGLIYVSIFLNHAGGLFTFTTYFLYLTKTLGFSNSDVLFLDTPLFIASFLLDIPTGFIADKYSRKLSFVLGTICVMFAHFVYFAYPIYTLLLAASVLMGLGFALISGAYEAWNLSFFKKEEYERFYKNKTVITNICTVTIPILSVLIAESFGYQWPIIADLIFKCIFLVTVIFFIKSNSVGNNLNSTDNIANLNLIAILKRVLKLKSVFILCVLAFILNLTGVSINSFQIPLISSLLGSANVGIIISLVGISGIVFVPLLYKRFGVFSSLFLMSVITILYGIISTPLIFIFIIFLRSMISDIWSIKYAEIQSKSMKDSIRASTLSFFSFIGTLGMIVANTLFGFMADSYSQQSTILLSGILLFGMFCIAFKYLKLPKYKQTCY